MSFNELRERCLKQGTLYEDPEFAATATSVYYSKIDYSIQWRRPTELTQDAKFVVQHVSRFDLDQGSLGNCWFIAGAATIATKGELFMKVVPADQGFDENYAGIFHFNFWRYGRWQEVIIDDRLPAYQGRVLAFCKNREQPNEFWSALLEKAYAKLHGSYEALDGGNPEDALVDMTGGVGERVDLTNKAKVPKGLFDTIIRTFRMNSLLSCSIFATKETREQRLKNGLVMGHAYSINKVIQLHIGPDDVKLMRLRNPWGQKEWNGPWSDGSREWLSLDADLRVKMGLTFDEDGEFWICYEDWVENFHQLQMCHIPSDNMMQSKAEWQSVGFVGAWVKGVSAGGCGNPPNQDMYWLNPQYRTTLKDLDDGVADGKCTLVVSLMQQHSRLLRTLMKVANANIAIGFDIYKVNRDEAEPLNGESFQRSALQLARRIDRYSYYREVTHHYRLEPGNYVIIPSVFQPNATGEFLLRLFTHKNAESIDLDTPTGPIVKPKSKKDGLKELFSRYAGADGTIDAAELRNLLNEAFLKELAINQEFEVEACRSLLAMMDTDKSGFMEYAETRKMWTELKTWQGAFKNFDKNRSGYIEVSELRSLLKSVGFTLSRNVLGSIVRRYGGRNGRLTLNDFVLMICKMTVMINLFSSNSDNGLGGEVKLTLDKWMEITMYY